MYIYIHIYIAASGESIAFQVFLRQCSFLLRGYGAQLTRMHVYFFDVVSFSSYAPALAEVTVLLPPSIQKYKNSGKS